MYDIFVEKHSIEDKPLSWHLARHIYSRGQSGKIAVVTDEPDALLAATHKQWIKLLRQAQDERSVVLNPAQVDTLTRRIIWMQGLSFTCKLPDDLLEADVTFGTVDDFIRVAPVCTCAYITYSFEREKIYMVTAWMPRDSLVVIYE